MATSTHKSIADAVVTSIIAIGLTDYPNAKAITTGQVLARWGVEVQPNKLPAIFVQPNGVESVVGGTNERDDIAYPIRVDIVDRQSQLEEGAIDTVLYWRELVRKKFINQRLSTYAYICRFDPSPVLDAASLKEYQLLVEPLFFQFISRQARG